MKPGARSVTVPIGGLESGWVHDIEYRTTVMGRSLTSKSQRCINLCSRQAQQVDEGCGYGALAGSYISPGLSRQDASTQTISILQSLKMPYLKNVN